MRNRLYITAAIIAAGLSVVPFAGGIYARQEGRHQSQGHDAHAKSVNERGDHVMGFDHEKTTHHFLLRPDGGAIEVTANDAGDEESRDQIRKHLGHIAKMFAEGNFKAPMLIHDRVPPGVPVMERLRGEIRYNYEDVKRGGRVTIKTANGEALRAVHEFLRFQIEDHRTGDTTEVGPPRRQ
jgi:hypothetical protein